MGGGASVIGVDFTPEMEVLYFLKHLKVSESIDSLQVGSVI